MRKILTVILFLTAMAVTLRAQTVLENESSILFGEKSANVTLVVVNDKPAFDGKIALEFIDTYDKVRGRTELQVTFEPGRTSHLIAVNFGDLSEDDRENLAWFRLRYQAGEANGVVSVSEINRDLFDLRVIASDLALSGMNYRARVRAVNPKNQQPVRGVSLNAVITLGLRDNDDDDDNDPTIKFEKRGETDADGFAVMDFRIPTDQNLSGDGMILVKGVKNGIHREARDGIRLPPDDHRFLALIDKPIYQPGQTFNIRGLLFKGSEKQSVVPDRDVEFRIFDETDTVLFRQTVKTSAFGVASIDWQIPGSAKLGDYWIRIRVNDQDESMYVAAEKFRVSRYEIPNFAVNAKSRKSFYLPTERTAEVEVSADYLFGKPVTNGKVRVVRETERTWNWKEQKYDIEEGDSREGEVDKDGKFTARFDLSEDHEELKDRSSRFEDLRFAAYFTDLTTNRTEQRRFDVRVTREPIHVYYIGDQWDVNPNIPVTAYVSTFYADGTPAACDVEFKAREESGDDDKYRTLQRLRTNSFGAGRLTYKRPKYDDEDASIEIQLIARDKNGLSGTYGVGEDDEEEIEFEADDEALRVTTNKTIFKPGETIEIEIESTLESGTVFVDVLSGLSVVESRFVALSNGRARLKIPFRSEFSGQLTVTALMDDEDEVIHGSRGIIFPAPKNLRVDASFDKDLYKPGAEASVAFGVLDANGKAIESALGVVIYDKAIEERVRTESDFGGGANRGYRDWIGYGDGFGDINIKDINELDLKKPIDDELQLVAEVILYDQDSRPNVFRNRGYDSSAETVYTSYFRTQFGPFEEMLKEHFEKRDTDHPVDDETFERILRENEFDYAALRDPWHQKYRVNFEIQKSQDIVRVETSGPDKKFGTADDFTVSRSSFAYFTNTAKALEKAFEEYRNRTGKFIRDEKTLLNELGVAELRDRFGRLYQFRFGVDRKFFTTRIRSVGKDGTDCDCEWQDDFEIWRNSTNYFAADEARISSILKGAESFPKNESEFRAVLNNAGFDFDALRDGFDEKIYLTKRLTARFADRETVEKYRREGETVDSERKVITPVVQEVLTFSVRSKGPDRRENTSDDFTLADFQGVVSERSKDDKAPKPVVNQPISYRASTGSIGGKVTDANGAAVPGAVVTVINNATNLSRSVTTSDEGTYFVTGLETGTYTVTAESPHFQKSVVSSVRVTGGMTVVDLILEPGGATATVDVVSGPTMVATSSGKPNVISNEKSKSPKDASQIIEMAAKNDNGADSRKSTPRLRNYFPETLFWAPEILTDKNGKATVNLKMADNITTLKMFAIASTKDGRIGVAENEVTAFQSFFVDLDPPKFLTEGDEIYLPTQVRNYTSAKQRVSVTMTRADWFQLLTEPLVNIEVAPGSATNSVFGFRATTPIKDGKQKVAAIAQRESDAIEKSVTVNPNGHEVIRTESKLFTGRESFALDFPANALAKTPRAELKIYPNLMSHVTESVEGLLARPNGCGEQTISSAYPNMMILKFGVGDESLKKKARKYLQDGYGKLLGYQMSDGGFSYWGGKDASDIALTAYAIRFMTDASPIIGVDSDIIDNAADYLIKQQRVDGSFTKIYSWEKAEDPKRTKLLTTYVARSLAMIKAKSGKPVSRKFDAVLAKALAYVKERSEEIDEPYSIALYGLAAFDAGDRDSANKTAARLAKLAITEGQTAYWNLETNTPFYGWGTAGRIETTALALQLLVRTNDQKTTNNELISKATIFLLRNKDRYGVWHSTQTTINVFDAFLASLKPARAEKITITSGGNLVKEIAIPADQIEPISVDLNGQTSPNVEIAGAADAQLMAQVVRSHYVDWKNAEVADRGVNQSRAVELDYRCDKQAPKIMETVTCSVKAERVGFKGYGMLLAEVGIPPGADVSRESLEKAVESDWSISRYEVQPDRIIFYFWAKAGGTKFDFTFKPRYGINAQTPPSVLYDYYNEEAKATVKPMRFEAK